MSLSIAGARSSVKSRLDIPSANTTFDSVIDEFVTDSVNRLFPMAAQEVAAQTVTVAPDSYGDVTIDLSTGLVTAVQSARLVEMSSGYEWQPNRSLYHHGTSLRVRGCPGSTTSLKIYGLNPFVLTNVPDNLAPAIYWYAMSEFYDYLAGNKRKYNIYSQASGGRSVDNMAAESTFYSEKADAYVNDHATVY